MFHSPGKLFHSGTRSAAILLLILTSAIRPDSTRAQQPTQGTVFGPHLEWSLANPTVDGNPYDLIAEAVFTHTESGETRKTGMFYDGDGTWKFRFTATRAGVWQYRTESADPDLHGKTGTVNISENTSEMARGFLTHFDEKWGWSGSGKAFVPQYAMYEGPRAFYRRPGKIDTDIDTFIDEHGFNGFHVQGGVHWLDLDADKIGEVGDANPDRRTFEAMETLIQKVYAAGGVVHFWMWGDVESGWTPKGRWPLNGSEDKRLLRYVAARLGPLPGWSVGYGFDLDEWADEADLFAWHEYMQDQLGWKHLMGGRDVGPNSGTDHRNRQIYEGLDYAGYEHHRPDYNVYVAAITARPRKPTLSEDRFRIRGRFPKDYSMGDVRRGLWRSTMAGGVGNIWGNVRDGNRIYEHSLPFPDPAVIKTYSRFFENRFFRDLSRANDLTNGVCLRRADNSTLIFYRENTGSIRMNLRGMSGNISGIAVDTRKPYQELQIEGLSSTDINWQAPYTSDWAIAIGAAAIETQPDTLAFAPPATFDLGQNYPNPFNPGTTIPFTLDEASHVSLRIYDVHGREVAVLLDDARDAGPHQLTWNIASIPGLPSGVFFYTLATAAGRETRKMAVVR